MGLKALFEFICKNPPMALIGGGILFYLQGSMFIPFSSESASVLLSTAPWLIGSGIFLQLVWLFRDKISDSLN